MQQIAEFSLWFFLGALAYAGIHLTVVEWRESKRLEREAMMRHPSTHDYSRLDHLDGLSARVAAYVEADRKIQRLDVRPAEYDQP